MAKVPENNFNEVIGIRYRRQPIHLMDGYVRTLPYIRNKTVCDLGCGRGDGMLIQSFFAKSLVGVDINKRAYKYAHRHKYFCPTSIMILDLNEAYPPEHFEVITCLETLEHLKDPKKLIASTNWDMFIFEVPYAMPGRFHIQTFNNADEVNAIIPQDKVSKIELELIEGVYRVILWR